MPYTTTTELRTRLGEEVGDTSSTSSTLSRFVNLLDEAHVQVVGGGGVLNLDEKGKPMSRPYIFSWAMEQHPLVFNTTQKIVTGTVSVTQSSTSITLSSAPTSSVAGWFFQVTGTQKLYRIASHTALSTSATLDGAYTDATSSAASYVLAPLDYTLGNTSSNRILLTASYVRCAYPPYRVSITDHDELLDRYPRSLLYEGLPYLMSLKKYNSGELIVSLSSYPENIERFELHYVKKPTTLDTSGNNPIIPEEDRDILVYLAAYYHMMKTDDSRASDYFMMARARFEAMKTKDMQLKHGNDDLYGYVPSFYSDGHIDSHDSGLITTEHLRYIR